MESSTAIFADTATESAIDENVIGNSEIHDEIDVSEVIQGLGLREGTREAVENEAVVTLR